MDLGGILWAAVLFGGGTAVWLYALELAYKEHWALVGGWIAATVMVLACLYAAAKEDKQ